MKGAGRAGSPQGPGRALPVEEGEEGRAHPRCVQDVPRPGAEPGRGALRAPGMALTLRDPICVFYGLETAQIHIVQEEGQDKSAESKATEKPPDTLLMEVQVLDKVKLEMCCSLLASAIAPIWFRLKH